jgi:hypothetical protein
MKFAMAHWIALLLVLVIGYFVGKKYPTLWGVLPG